MANTIDLRGNEQSVTREDAEAYAAALGCTAMYFGFDPEPKDVDPAMAVKFGPGNPFFTKDMEKFLGPDGSQFFYNTAMYQCRKTWSLRAYHGARSVEKLLVNLSKGSPLSVMAAYVDCTRMLGLCEEAQMSVFIARQLCICNRDRKHVEECLLKAQEHQMSYIEHLKAKASLMED
ncbi:hypothetical protein KF5_006 [Vibrio phage vB_VpaS_KF5]|uniref:Uncharacterized protein n=3 Tax=Mardecavirus SSP002 TaxID=1921699 RepID=H9EB06_9CAUD|nr:hypothetical protein FDH27_gp006 [Vibrio phage SSP002]ATI19316.1 hypothetical protein KF5_006 [Vibrio phage vB_VpaS_KF5]QEP53374.1 hypothetical protein HCMJ_6 [Vibrio phage vB_VpaS_HCMJ]UGC97159.1 hypothetical protein OTA22_6 [Vibrio phage OTA22]UYE96225.1 hypothetical protein [Vibrio phage 31Fb.4]UYE96384.1 hypothetical protein [Vibrio phage 33Fb.4]WGL39780.1 hypothetical protein PG288_100 [Vibrio phage PG288]WJZ44461.1 hypothetical protein VPy01_75 [Vibrio phage VPy01]